MDDENVLEFRDGKRVVPDYLYPEMSQLETHRMTYEQAVKEADTARMNRWLGDQQHNIMVGHFSKGRGY
jgi:hypothetical protein